MARNLGMYSHSNTGMEIALPGEKPSCTVLATATSLARSGGIGNRKEVRFHAAYGHLARGTGTSRLLALSDVGHLADVAALSHPASRSICAGAAVPAQSGRADRLWPLCRRLPVGDLAGSLPPDASAAAGEPVPTGMVGALRAPAGIEPPGALSSGFLGAGRAHLRQRERGRAADDQAGRAGL